MDQAGIEIRGKELAVGLVEGEIADAGAAVGIDPCELADRSGHAVDFPDRARAAAILFSELACHEGCFSTSSPLALRTSVSVLVRRHDADAMQRGRRGVEVRNATWSAVADAVVILHAEDLADLPGQHLERRGRVDELAGWRAAES